MPVIVVSPSGADWSEVEEGKGSHTGRMQTRGKWAEPSTRPLQKRYGRVGPPPGLPRLCAEPVTPTHTVQDLSNGFPPFGKGGDRAATFGR
jgi:hypothetical protein